jgi:hypothetical protein
MKLAPKGAFLFGDKMLAKQLKEISEKAKIEKLNEEAESLFIYICNEAKRTALTGQTSFRFWLRDRKKEIALAIKPRLEAEGFKCIVSRDATAYYSPLDYDEEDFIEVSW